jgi:Rrf2 family protein
MLSKKCKYAIKALIALAKRDASRPHMSIQEISAQEKLPRKFLENILLELKSKRIVSSKLGKAGGYYLLRKADGIFLSELIRIIDGPIALLPCVSLNFYESCEDCDDERTCGLRKVLMAERVASLGVLANISIAMIVKKERRLVNALKPKTGKKPKTR